jgi:hypothetical protein
MVNKAREAFDRIMGAIDMPDDGEEWCPDYDEWLFRKTWDAAIDECAAIAEESQREQSPAWSAACCQIADALRALKGNEVAEGKG